MRVSLFWTIFSCGEYYFHADFIILYYTPVSVMLKENPAMRMKRAILILLLVIVATTVTVTGTVLADDNDTVCLSC